MGDELIFPAGEQYPYMLLVDNSPVAKIPMTIISGTTQASVVFAYILYIYCETRIKYRESSRLAHTIG